MEPTSLVPHIARRSVENSTRSATITTNSVQQLRHREFEPSSASFVCQCERGPGCVPCSAPGM